MVDEARQPDGPSLVGATADLAQREDEGNPVRVCIIGAGEMGTDLVTAIRQMRALMDEARSEAALQSSS